MKSRITILSLFLIIFILLQGCSFTLFSKKKKERLPITEYYQEGLALFKKGKYKKSRDIFRSIREDYPFNKKITPMADLRYADSLFYSYDYQSALIWYKAYKKLYPASPFIPYVLYQTGLCYYNMMRPPDRDQTYTKNAIKTFKELIKEYPNTPFANAVGNRIEKCRENLAEHEFYVGKFYFKKKKYIGSLRRFKKVLKDYPGSKIEDKTLYFLAFSYHKLKKPQKALKTLARLINNYPNSKYQKKAKELLIKIKSEKPIKKELIKSYLPLKSLKKTKKANLKKGILPFEPLTGDNPIDISADTLEGGSKKNVVIFKGNVITKCKDLVIRSDYLTIKKAKGGKGVSFAKAYGDVIITQNNRKGKADTLIYDANEKKIVMQGNPKLTSNEGIITGDSIQFLIDKKILIINGNNNIRAKAYVSGKAPLF